MSSTADNTGLDIENSSTAVAIENNQEKPDVSLPANETPVEEASPLALPVESKMEEQNDLEDDEKIAIKKNLDEKSRDGDEKIDIHAMGMVSSKAYCRVSARRRILVNRTEERKTTLSKYLVYLIECDPKTKGVDTVARRYNDFVWLRRTLTEEFPALWVPPLPPKKRMGRFDKDFVEGRRSDLERFLDRVDAIDAFGDSEAFIAFLSSPETTFKVEVEKQIGELTWGHRNVKLQELFPEIHTERLSGEEESDLGTIREFLEKCKAQLETLLSSCQTCLTKHDLHAQEIAAVTEAFEELYTVESEHPYCQPQRLKISKQFEEWQDFERKQTRLFEQKFLHTIQHEYEDVIALIELLNRRVEAQTRYAKANASATKLRTKEQDAAGLNEKQMAQKETEEHQEQMYKEYLDLATKVLLMHETRRVWRDKVQTFETSMANFCETQLKQTEEMRQIWSEAISA